MIKPRELKRGRYPGNSLGLEEDVGSREFPLNPDALLFQEK